MLTLTSLSYTLYELGKNGAEADFIADVIAGFGVALSSTIVGVAVRVMFLQFRLDLVSRDREARLAINDAMRNFRAELTDVIRGTKYIGVEIRQSLAEFHEDLAKTHKESSQRVYGDLIETFRASLGPLNEQLTTMSHEVVKDAQAAVSASSDARNVAMSKTTEGLATASKLISEELTNAVAAAQRTLTEALNEIAIARSVLADEAKETSKQLSEVRSTSMHVLLNASQRTSDTVVGAAGTAAAEVEKSTTATLEALNSVRTSAQQLVQQLQAQVDTLAKMNLAVQQAETRSQNAAADVLLQVRDIAFGIAQSERQQLQVLEQLVAKQAASQGLSSPVAPTA